MGMGNQPPQYGGGGMGGQQGGKGGQPQMMRQQAPSPGKGGQPQMMRSMEVRPEDNMRHGGGMQPGKGGMSQGPVHMAPPQQGIQPGKGGEQVRGGPVMRTPPQSGGKGSGPQPQPGGKGGTPPPQQGYPQPQGFTPFGQLMRPQMQRPMGIHQQLMGNFRSNPQATQDMLINGPRLVNPIGGMAPGSGPGTMAPGGQQPSPGGAPGGAPGPNIGVPDGRGELGRMWSVHDSFGNN